MSKTISGTYTSLFTLSGAADDPATITATGLLDAGLYAASLGAAWMITNSGSVLGAGIGLGSTGTVVNDGRIAGTYAYATGVSLTAGGSVTNASTALITGYVGVQVTGGAGTVINYGTITVSGGHGNGDIYLAGGGVVINHAGGTIGAPASNPGAVYILGGAGTVNNAGIMNAGVWLQTFGTVSNQNGGKIISSSTSGGYGVGLHAGGTVTNAGQISGLYLGVELDAGGAVTNQTSGVISGAYVGVLLGFPGDTAAGGGSLINQAGGLISGDGGVLSGDSSATVTNAGNISGTTATTVSKGAITLVLGAGVYLTAGGTVTNQSGGSITGVSDGVSITNGAGTVVNYGSIAGLGAGGSGVDLLSGGLVSNTATGTITSAFDVGVNISGGVGTVLNAGQISVGGSHTAVVLDLGGSVTNQVGGTITGGTTHAAVYITGASGMVANYGVLQAGSSATAVVFENGGSVTNQVGGTITGGTTHAAVYITGASGTVANRGVLLAGSTAVVFEKGGSVTNQSGGTITGGTTHGAVYITGAVGTVTNYGQLSGGGVAGVHLQAGGTVSNQTGGTITSGTNHAGVYVTGGSSGVVYNAGLISGVDLFSGGGVTNQATGTISSGNAIAVDVAGAAGTVVNTGQIVSGGTHPGLYLKSGGTITNAAGATIAGGGAGVDITGSAAGTVINAGTIGSGGTHSAVALLHGGYVSNAQTGTITAPGGDAVYIGGGIGTVINAGSLAGGTTGPGVQLAHGGSITNVASGVIYGKDHSGVYAITAAATVLNAGTITGAGTSGTGGVAFKAGGYVSNAATGTITSVNKTGVYIIGGAGTVTNAGTIAGSGGTKAVSLAAGFTNLIVADPGAVFGGTVNGGNPIGAPFVSTLEFASGASGGTLSGLDSHYFNFTQITIDAGAAWTLTGANTIAAGVTLTELTGATVTDAGTLANYGSIVLDPSTLDAGGLIGTGSATIAAGSTLEVQNTIAGGETIRFAGSGGYLHLDSPAMIAGSVTNFDTGETIDLKGINPASLSYSGGVLNFTGGSFALALTNPGTVTAAASGDGAAISVCFLAGTRILTPSGERPVQQLAIGDMVTTHRGEVRRIEWIGTGKALATRGRRHAATPVIVCKGALADNVPCRDLRVTKGHSLYIDDVLIPVEFLVNHRSILWDDRAQEVTLYHIELATHDVLVAEGAPAESYRDDGNRWLFQNTNAGWALPAQEPCAPVLTGGPIVDAIWRRLLDRSGPRPGFVLTGDPDLHLVVDGVRMDAAERDGVAHTFHLPTCPTTLRIVSRAGAPAELGLMRDPRVLGVALRRITLRSGTRFRYIEPDDALLADGFHTFEPANGLRWTDGDAELPVALFDGFDGPLELNLHVGSTTQYPLFEEARSCAAA